MATYNDIKKSNITRFLDSETELYYDDEGANHSPGYLYLLAPAFDLKITLYHGWLSNPANIYVYATPFSFATNTWGTEFEIGHRELSRTESGTHHHHFVYNWTPSPTTDTVWKTQDDELVRLWEIRWTCSTAGKKWLRLRVNSLVVSPYDPKDKKIYGLSYIGEKHYGDFAQNRTAALADLNVSARSGSRILKTLDVYCVPAK